MKSYKEAAEEMEFFIQPRFLTVDSKGLVSSLGELHGEPAHLQQVQAGQDAHGADREEGQDESPLHQGAELDVSDCVSADANSEFRSFLKNNMPQITSNTSIYIRFSFLVVILIAILFVVLKTFSPASRIASYDVEENALLVNRPAVDEDQEDDNHHSSVCSTITS